MRNRPYQVLAQVVPCREAPSPPTSGTTLSDCWAGELADSHARGPRSVCSVGCGWRAARVHARRGRMQGGHLQRRPRSSARRHHSHPRLCFLQVSLRDRDTSETQATEAHLLYLRGKKTQTEAPHAGAPPCSHSTFPLESPRSATRHSTAALPSHTSTSQPAWPRSASRHSGAAPASPRSASPTAFSQSASAHSWAAAH